MDKLAYALKVFDLISKLVSQGADIASFVKEQRARINAMVDEGREPTKAEWDELFDLVQANSGKIQS